MNPPQVARLVRACLSSGSPKSRVLLHHNEHSSHLDPALVRPLGNVEFAPEVIDTAWGSFAACEMVLQCMRWLLDNRDFDWVVYLSGQDYPIRPLAQIESELAETSYDGFAEGKLLDQGSWKVGNLRYAYRYYDVPKFPGWRHVRERLRRVAEASLAAGKRLPSFVVPALRHGDFKVGLKPRRSPFTRTFPGYFGSAWWTLNRRAIESMMRAHERRPDLARHYRRCLFASSESFFQTLLLNDRSLNINTASGRRFIRWTNPDTGRPDVLRLQDLEEILASDAHFARKIDAAVDPGLLDRLDEIIGIR